MSQPVLLDNTVLTNFALINRPDFIFNLWPGACTTPAVQTEYAAGVATHQLPSDTWHVLPVVTLTPTETAFAERLHPRLGAGERTCIAVAYHQKGLFVSDDLDARRLAQAYPIPTTGTIGILLLNIQQQRLALSEGNELLARLIAFGYRSPVTHLDGFV
ncbi:MAG: hypothetical protein KC418_00325 [Anaerolineales bacterium]|nr:hypothetical protein [Anaerolineales bacterium]MCB8953087.1 hypothetical protein [Ardenticatenales bacterium]